MHKNFILKICLIILSFIFAFPYNTATAKNKTISIKKGPGMAVYVDRMGNNTKPLKVWYYVPESYTPNTIILFVMHGVKRNGRTYRDKWIPHAEEMDVLLVVPQFSKKYYRTGRSYALGNVMSDKNILLPEERWTLTAVENIFTFLKKRLKNKRKKYVIYGHSAGAQFVHRLVIFKPKARILMAVAANAGVYCFPTWEEEFPYGLKNTSISKTSLAKSFQKKLLIYLGEEDVKADAAYLSKSEKALKQGESRFERGQNFYKCAKGQAKKQGAKFRWKVKTAPGAGHSNAKMAKALVTLLEEYRVK
jgi:hypothetical protein